MRVVLNYLLKKAEKPVNYLYRPDDRNVPTRPQYDPHEVSMHDARAVQGQLSLDRYGFDLKPHGSATKDFYDEREVRTVYYPEVEQLVKQVTGASRVLVFDHNVRCAQMAKQRQNGAQQPVKFVHNDYTLNSGPQRVRDLFGGEAPALLERRVAFINVWRPIRGPVQESPLGVCDARSIAAGDFVPTDLKYRDRTGEIYSVTYSPEHRWFYVPAMLPEESLMLKCYDSIDDGRARFTAHSAFEDPGSPPDAAPRESIEARTIAIFAQ